MVIIEPSPHLVPELCGSSPVPDAALPNDDHAPTHGFQQALIFQVALAVALDLRPPPLRSRLRYPEAGTTLMTVPEAAVDKDHGLVFGQDEVGFPGEQAVLGAVDSEAVAETVEHRAQGQLGLRVASPDAGHDLGAFLRTEDVGHRGDPIKARDEDGATQNVRDLGCAWPGRWRANRNTRAPRVIYQWWTGVCHQSSGPYRRA